MVAAECTVPRSPDDHDERAGHSMGAAGDPRHPGCRHCSGGERRLHQSARASDRRDAGFLRRAGAGRGDQPRAERHAVRRRAALRRDAHGPHARARQQDRLAGRRSGAGSGRTAHPHRGAGAGAQLCGHRSAQRRDGAGGAARHAGERDFPAQQKLPALRAGTGRRRASDHGRPGGACRIC